MRGDLIIPGAGQTALRNFFFKSLDSEAPQVWEDLRDNVFPLCAELDISVLRPAVLDPDNCALPQVDLPFEAWALRWQLCYPWVIEYAKRDLLDWLENPSEAGRSGLKGHVVMIPKELHKHALWVLPFIGMQEPEHWELVKVSAKNGVKTEDRRVFDASSAQTIAGWNPMGETRTSARARLYQAVDEYLDRLEKLANDIGLQPPPDIRAPDHFGWLVQYLVLKRTCREIAAQKQFHERAVEDGVKNAASLLGIQLPKPPKGRPRGRRDRHPGFRNIGGR